MTNIGDIQFRTFLTAFNCISSMATVYVLWIE